MVLAPAGHERDGLPVLTRHPDPARHLDALSRGFSGRLVRLYRLEQQFLARRDGRAIEPAYLLLSTRQGGFPRFGFWLANDRLLTGTTLWDQFRALPRTHTFDLNAASLVDLLAVEGMSRAAAEAILSHAPYASLAQLGEVTGVGPSLLARFEAMAEGMARLRADAAEEDVESLGLMRIFRPFLFRAAAWLAVCAAGGALLYRAARRIWVPRLALNGIGAALVGLGATWMLALGLQVGERARDLSLLHQGLAWMLTSGGVTPFLPVVLFGLPGAVWQLAWHRSGRRAGLVIVAWALACLPALAITQPLF